MVPASELSTRAMILRYAVVAAVVGFWMALGWIFHADGNTYLLMGVPLLWLFQRFVARRPLRELWFAEPVRFALPWWGWLVAAGFMVHPLHALFTWQKPGWPTQLWLVCSMAGCLPLALSLTQLNRSRLRWFGFCLITSGTLGVLTVLLGFLVRGSAGVSGLHRLQEGLLSILRYAPVCFVLEEVFFRGGLDSYLSRPDDRWPWASAIFIATIWGWWHLPVVPLREGNEVFQILGLLVMLPLVHIGVGVFFSICWRRSGLLFVPAIVHAFIDAVRNALH
jgi:hypothetical protein